MKCVGVACRRHRQNVKRSLFVKHRQPHILQHSQLAPLPAQNLKDIVSESIGEYNPSVTICLDFSALKRTWAITVQQRKIKAFGVRG
jgi:hypothetical protein